MGRITTLSWIDCRTFERVINLLFCFFSVSSWRIEFLFLEMLSNVKILKKKFSFSSRNSRFWKKFSFTSRKNEILQTDSLSLLDSSLNVFSNSREKSYFALWVDFDHQCFAERESILKRQFCVVEQYSNFSQQKHLSDSILQNTIFILELDVRTPLCGGDTFSFLGQKKNKTEIGMWMVVGEFLFLVTKNLKSRRLDLLSNHEICLQNFSFSSRN